jgi:hypothetical protein
MHFKPLKVAAVSPKRAAPPPWLGMEQLATPLRLQQANSRAAQRSAAY